MPEDLRRRLNAIAAGERRPAQHIHRLPQLYRLAVAALAAAARLTGRWEFTEADARRALGGAAAALARPGAGDFGPQPDAGDVAAFLRRLQEDETVTRGPGGYAINEQALPY